MISTSKLVFLALFLAIVQGVPARVTPGKPDVEFGRSAAINEMKALDALGEDEGFWYRALQSSLSVSMSMSMPMEPASESETSAEGATGESSGVSTESTSDAQASEPAQEVTEAPLKPVESAVADSQSSATKALCGFSCIISGMGMLLF